MERSYLHKLTNKKLPAHCGRKAEQIQKLLSYGDIGEPVTYVCTWDAYEPWLINDKKRRSVYVTS